MCILSAYDYLIQISVNSYDMVFYLLFGKLLNGMIIFTSYLDISPIALIHMISTLVPK